jgi:hypothetical protein
VGAASTPKAPNHPPAQHVRCCKQRPSRKVVTLLARKSRTLLMPNTQRRIPVLFTPPAQAARECWGACSQTHPSHTPAPASRAPGRAYQTDSAAHRAKRWASDTRQAAPQAPHPRARAHTTKAFAEDSQTQLASGSIRRAGGSKKEGERRCRERGVEREVSRCQGVEVSRGRRKQSHSTFFPLTP